MKKLFLFAICAVTSGFVYADLKDAVKVYESGKWAVLRDMDKMTDKVVCTGVYGKDYGKQLTIDNLFVSVKGGISGVTMRFDDNAAFPFRLGTKMEKDIRSLILEGGEFQSAVAAKRLRMQVGTLVSGIQDFDIDLTGLTDALENIKQGCPVPTVIQASTTPLPVVSSKIESAPTCNAEMISKMQKAGVTKVQLTQVCGLR